MNMYAYVGNDPMNVIDPNGRASISVHFKDQPIHLYGHVIPQSISGGHSGVVMINDQTGLTRYREFGRYNGSSGAVRGATISNLELGKNGSPTPQSLSKVFSELQGIGAKAGSSDIDIKYQNGGSFEKMMQEAKGWENKTWFPGGNTCHGFADAVVGAGGGDGQTTSGSLGRDNAGLANNVSKSNSDNGMSGGKVHICSGMGAEKQGSESCK